MIKSTHLIAFLFILGVFLAPVASYAAERYPSYASYEYKTPSGEPYRIIVYTKEQWNNIRNAETRAMISSNFRDKNHYYGEGRYLGESMNFIFAYAKN